MSAGAGGAFRAVSVGGGTGQPNVIRAFRLLGAHASAIVSMVDDGGSTGILRAETGMNPPGDVRKCLVAMAADPSSPLARALDHRFGFADNHALGNLLLAALTAETGSFACAVDVCSRMLECEGDVIPSTLDDVVLCGTTRDGMEFRGQASLGTGPCALSRVWLSPREAAAFPPAVKAIMEADLVVLGPGSLFTSIIPNLLVPGILEAVRATQARVVYVCSLADMQGETWGLTAEEHVDALLSHGLEGAVDAVFIHRPSKDGKGVATRCFQALTQERIDEDAAQRARNLRPNVDADPDPDWYFRPVQATDASLERISRRIPLVVARDFADPDHPTWHATVKLASALKGVVEACPSPLR